MLKEKKIWTVKTIRKQVNSLNSTFPGNCSSRESRDGEFTSMPLECAVAGAGLLVADPREDQRRQASSLHNPRSTVLASRETEIFWAYVESIRFVRFVPLSFNRHLWVGDLPFLIFKAKTSETPSQTVCSLAAWLGESEKVLGDSGFGVCHYRLSLPPPHQGTARWIPLQSSPMDAALFQCNPAGAADWSPLVGNMLRSYKETFQRSWFPKGCLLTYLLTYLCFPTSTHTHTQSEHICEDELLAIHTTNWRHKHQSNSCPLMGVLKGQRNLVPLMSRSAAVCSPI